MSHFLDPGPRISWLEARLNLLESLLRQLTQPDGTIRQDGGGSGTSGVVQTHEHEGTGEGGKPGYEPAVYTDWENSVDPGDVWGALDQLAERVQDLDSLTVSPVTMMMTGMEQATVGTSTHTFKVVTKTAAYTATDADTVILCDATAAAFTVTLPAAAARTGKVFEVKKVDASANHVTVDGSGAETIDDGATAVLTVQYESITIVSSGSEWFIL